MTAMDKKKDASALLSNEKKDTPACPPPPEVRPLSGPRLDRTGEGRNGWEDESPVSPFSERIHGLRNVSRTRTIGPHGTDRGRHRSTGSTTIVPDHSPSSEPRHLSVGRTPGSGVLEVHTGLTVFSGGPLVSHVFSGETTFPLRTRR